MESHHHIESHDSTGKLIGIQTALLAVLLSIFTIFAHREHTNTLLFSNETSNAWAHYQAKRIREYQAGMNADLIKLLAPNNPEAVKMLSDYDKQAHKYGKELQDIKAEAELKGRQEAVAHHKAGYFDLSEALFEIAVVLSSLYFISRRRFFPVLGLFLGSIGLIIGVIGLSVQ